MRGFEFIRGLAAITPAHRGCVATVGAFDGMHLGHRAIIARLVAKAAALQVPAMVILFEPQPAEFFNPQQAPARLMRLREKLHALQTMGVQRVLCLKFNAPLRALSAVDFVQGLLVQRLGVLHLEVGDDFRFGAGREGDYALLQAMAPQAGFTLANSHTLSHNQQRVSSTRVRQLLAQGDFPMAQTLLGQPFSVLGRVAYGRQLARSLGAPTANIPLGRNTSPVRGVFAVWVACQQGVFAAVANVGVKPTLGAARAAKPLLEVHLLGVTVPLYGQWLRVTFCTALRAERAFASLAELQHQITLDIQAAQRYFAASPAVAAVPLIF